MIWPLNPKPNRRPAAEQPAPSRPTAKAPEQPLFPRMRRNRKAEWARALVRENVLTVERSDLADFVCEGVNLRQPIASMPGVQRLSIDQALTRAERA